MTIDTEPQLTETEAIEMQLIAAADRLGLQDVVTGDYLEHVLGVASELRELDDRRFCHYDDEQGLFGLEVDEYEEMAATDMPYLAFESGLIERVRLHFSPEVRTADGGTRQYGYKTPNDQKDFLGKQEAIARMSIGMLSYILLVEADVVEKPHLIEGLTNKTMARFAEKFGLKRFETWQAEQKTGEAPQPTDEDVQYALDKALSIQGIEQAIEDKKYDDYEDHSMRVAWGLTECIDQTSPGPLQDALKKLIVNITMLDDANERDIINQRAFGKYEDVRDGVVAFYLEKGRKIVERHAAAAERLGLHAVRETAA